MSIDPRIALGVQVPDAGQAIGQGLMNTARMQQMMEAKAKAARDEELFPLQKAALEGQQDKLNAELQQMADDRNLYSIYRASQDLKNIGFDDPMKASIYLQNRIETLRESGRDTTESEEALAMIQSGDIAGVQNRLKQIEQLAIAKGIAPKPSAFAEKMAAAGFTPGTPEYQQAVRDLLKPAGTHVEVTVDNAKEKGMTAFQEMENKNQANYLASLREQADAALVQNEELYGLENFDIKTGTFENLKATTASVLSGLGVPSRFLDFTNVAGVQAYNAKVKNIVLAQMAKQKGPQTEADMKLIEQTVANIGNEQEANRFINRSVLALNDMVIDRYNWYQAYADKHGNLDGANQEYMKYRKKVPMVSNSVTDPTTGMPMFYRDFKNRLMDKLQGNITEQQLIEAWNRRIKKGKQ